MTDQDTIHYLTNLYDVLVQVSTGNSYHDDVIRETFNKSRKAVLLDTRLSNILPYFIATYSDLPSFWSFITDVAPSYSERRRFLAESFAPLFLALDTQSDSSTDQVLISGSFDTADKYIMEIWSKCKERVKTDPEGAITSSRTLLEAVCKYILDGLMLEYKKDDGLQRLYKRASNALELAPSQHTNQQFKQLLSGAISIVGAISSIRNAISDSHAIPKNSGRASKNHATLCVNLSGSLANFLITSYRNLVFDPDYDDSDDVFLY